MSSSTVKRRRGLAKEIDELQAVRGELEERVASLEGDLKRTELERDYLARQIEKFRRMLFGQRSEKIPPRVDGLKQLELFEEAKKEIDIADLEETEEINYRRKKRRGARRPIPEDLHREEIEIDVDPELRVCPDCGDEMCCIGHDVSEDLEYLPARLFVIAYLLKKYACPKCQSGVVGAKRPPRPISRVRAGAGLLAYILVSKYQDHLPLHRLERIFARDGMEICRKTLCDWVQKSGELLRPIVESQKRGLLEKTLLQVDETPIKVRDPEVKGKTARGYIWTYGVAGEEVVYDFRMGRSAAGPEEFFAGNYPRYIQADSYSVYKSLEGRGKTLHVACWSHARRKFYEARAEDPEFLKLILSAIQKLFRIERGAKEEGLAGEALLERRQSDCPPILEMIKALCEAKRSVVIPASGIGEAIEYALANWTALTRYVEVAEAEISNNSAESSLRGVVLGRNNWLFVGHPNAGPRAAVILSLVETCRRLGIDPYAYLRSVIAELAVAPELAAELTPRKWREREAQKAENSIASTAP